MWNSYHIVQVTTDIFKTTIIYQNLVIINQLIEGREREKIAYDIFTVITLQGGLAYKYYILIKELKLLQLIAYSITMVGALTTVVFI